MAQTTAEPLYKTLLDGSIEISFDKRETKAPIPSCFLTQFQIEDIEAKRAEVISFSNSGAPIYAFESTTGHVY